VRSASALLCRWGEWEMGVGPLLSAMPRWVHLWWCVPLELEQGVLSVPQMERRVRHGLPVRVGLSEHLQGEVERWVLETVRRARASELPEHLASEVERWGQELVRRAHASELWEHLVDGEERWVPEMGRERRR
jgi:hypothetical protein